MWVELINVALHLVIPVSVHAVLQVNLRWKYRLENNNGRVAEGPLLLPRKCIDNALVVTS